MDVLYACIKPEDWLKESARKIIAKINRQHLEAYTNLASVVELEIVSSRDFDREFSLDIIEKLRAIGELRLTPLTREILEAADRLRRTYNRLGIFDAIHAESASLGDQRIVSTDPIYDQIDGLKRLDPREA